MTTTVKVHVNGRYRATVDQTYADGRTEQTIIDGNGLPPSSGERSFYIGHPADATFRIVEVYVPETKDT